MQINASERRKKQVMDFGPVVLFYFKKSRSVDPQRVFADSEAGLMRRERFPTNKAAWARIHELWGQANFHEPYIKDESGETLWNSVQVRQGVESQDAAQAASAPFKYDPLIPHRAAALDPLVFQSNQTPAEGNA
jgi:hypothetical protein